MGDGPGGPVSPEGGVPGEGNVAGRAARPNPEDLIPPMSQEQLAAEIQKGAQQRAKQEAQADQERLKAIQDVNDAYPPDGPEEMRALAGAKNNTIHETTPGLSLAPDAAIPPTSGPADGGAPDAPSGGSNRPDAPSSPNNPPRPGSPDAPQPGDPGNPKGPDAPPAMTPPTSPAASGGAKEKTGAERDLEAANARIAAVGAKPEHQGKTWDGTNPEKMRKDYGADFKDMRDAHADKTRAETEKTLDEAQTQQMTPEQLQENEEARMEARRKATLEKDDKYQSLQEKLTKLKGKEKSKEYRETKLAIDKKQLDAEYNEMQQRARDGVDPDTGKPLSVAERSAKVANLEKRRTDDSVAAILKANPDYEKLKPALEQARKNLQQNYPNARVTVEDLLNESWADVVSGGYKDIFGSEAKFVDAQDARAKEVEARRLAQTTRGYEGFDIDGRDLHYDKDGEKVKDKEFEKAKANVALKAAKDNDPGPGALRRSMRWLYDKGEKYFGKRTADEAGKEARGLIRRLLSDYGWRALIPIPGAKFLFLDKEKRTQVGILREQAVGAIVTWARINMARWGIFGIPLAFLILWVAQPIIMAKILEVSKPFGGNGNG